VLILCHVINDIDMAFQPATQFVKLVFSEVVVNVVNNKGRLVRICRNSQVAAIVAAFTASERHAIRRNVFGSICVRSFNNR
jgi:hypothetical protein